MIKKETLVKIRKMLKELGWSDEIVNKYLIESLEMNESQVIVPVE